MGGGESITQLMAVGLSRTMTTLTPGQTPSLPSRHPTLHRCPPRLTSRHYLAPTKHPSHVLLCHGHAATPRRLLGAALVPRR